jgi:hypothetical protein
MLSTKSETVCYRARPKRLLDGGHQLVARGAMLVTPGGVEVASNSSLIIASKARARRW